MSSTVGIKLDDNLRSRLKALGQLKDRSSHWLMKTAIAEYVEREERRERERIEDEERWQRYLDTGVAISQDEMLAWLDNLKREAHEARQQKDD